MLAPPAPTALGRESEVLPRPDGPMAVEVEAVEAVDVDEEELAVVVDELLRRLVAAVNAAEAFGAELVPVEVELEKLDVDEVDEAAAAVVEVERSRL